MLIKKKMYKFFKVRQYLHAEHAKSLANTDIIISLNEQSKAGVDSQYNNTNNTEESALYYKYKKSTILTSHSFDGFVVPLDPRMQSMLSMSLANTDNIISFKAFQYHRCKKSQDTRAVCHFLEDIKISFKNIKIIQLYR